MHFFLGPPHHRNRAFFRTFREFSGVRLERADPQIRLRKLHLGCVHIWNVVVVDKRAFWGAGSDEREDHHGQKTESAYRSGQNHGQFHVIALRFHDARATAVWTLAAGARVNALVAIVFSRYVVPRATSFTVFLVVAGQCVVFAPARTRLVCSVYERGLGGAGRDALSGVVVCWTLG